MSSGVTNACEVSYDGPLDVEHLLGWFAARAIDGVEVVGRRSYSRVVDVGGDPVAVTLAFEGRRVSVHSAPSTPAGETAAARLAHRLFDLAADARAADAALSRVPALACSVGAAPGRRIPGTPDAYDCLVRAVTGQQVTVAAGRATCSRLASLAPVVETGVDGLHTVLPAPDEAAARVDEWYRGPRSRRDTLVRVLGAVAEGDLDLRHDQSAEDVRRCLLPWRGIGPWTASYVALRLTQDPDVVVTGDVALLTGARNLGVATTQAELAAWLETCRPWRSYACLHLWAAA